MSLRIYCCLLFVPFVLAGTTTRAAESEDAGLLLERIKQALLEQSIGNGVQVVSSAYVDSSGKLVESAFYTSSTEVSGVRVLSYLQDEQDEQPHAFAALSSLPDSLQPWVQGRCASPGSSSFQRNVSYSLGIEAPNLPELVPPAARLFSDRLEAVFGQDRHWRLHADTSRALASRYQQLLFGRDMAVETDYRIHISVVELASVEDVPGLLPALGNMRRGLVAGLRELISRNPVMETRPQAVVAPLPLRFVFRFEDKYRSASAQHREYYAVLVRDASSLVQASVVDELLEDFERSLDDWRVTLNPGDACQAALAYVHPDRDASALRLNAGSANGLAEGDRFLLLGHNLLQDGVLNADWAATLAIGEVVVLDAYSALVRPLTALAVPVSDFRYALPF